MKFSEFLKDLRSEGKISQVSLAEEIEVSKQTISNWENDRATPSVKDTEIISKIAKVFSIQPEIIISVLTPTFEKKEESAFYNEYVNYFDPNGLELSEEEVEIFLLYMMCCYEDGKKSKVSALLQTRYKTIDLCNILDRLEQKILNEPLQVKDWVFDIIKKYNLNKFDLTQLSYLDYYKYLSEINYDLSKTISFIQEYQNSDKIIRAFNGEFCEYKEEYEIPYDPKWTDTDGIILRAFTEEMIVPVEYIISGESKVFEDYDKECQTVIKKYIADHMPALDIPMIKMILGTNFRWKSEDKKEYEVAMEQYEIDLRAWEEKMVEIKKLQELYNDKEKYPDLPKPTEPEKPTRIPFAFFNKKGLKLLELYNITHQQETIEASDKAKNYRWQLSNYIEQNITIDAGIAELSSNKICLYDVYIGNKYVSDHMWIYNNIELFTPDFKEADRIVIEGKVYEYTNSEGLKNLSVSPTKIEKY